jgi:hypothetical protein
MQDTGLFRALVEEALAAGTVVRFRAEGTSMHPTIRDGDVITIAPVSSGDVVRGDVLLCRRDARMLAHRLVAVTTRGAERRFHFRGDAVAGCDAPVGADALVGKVISVCRYGRAAPFGGRGARLRHTARRLASRAAAHSPRHMNHSTLVAQRADDQRSFVTRQIAGETLVVPVAGHVMDLQSIFVLNPVASRIWELLAAPTTADRIAGTIAAEFAVSRPDAASDVVEFLETLGDRGLIHQLPEGA